MGACGARRANRARCRAPSPCSDALRRRSLYRPRPPREAGSPREELHRFRDALGGPQQPLARRILTDELELLLDQRRVLLDARGVVDAFVDIHRFWRSRVADLVAGAEVADASARVLLFLRRSARLALAAPGHDS